MLLYACGNNDAWKDVHVPTIALKSAQSSILLDSRERSQGGCIYVCEAVTIMQP